MLQIRLSEGMYPIFLEDWFRVFPRDQILILMFEEYVKDIKGNILKVFDFLGLSKKFITTLLTSMPHVKNYNLHSIDVNLSIYI